MNEYVDVLDISGAQTGKIKLRNNVHKDGDWHQSVHLWLMKGNEILVQKRSSTKESYPGCFDATVAGHVSAGEEIFETAKRECIEEVGVTLPKNKFVELGVLKLCIEHNERRFISNEFNHVLVANVEQDISFKINLDEIEAIKWMEINYVYDEIVNGNHQFCISIDEIRLLMDYLGGKHESN